MNKQEKTIHDKNNFIKMDLDKFNIEYTYEDYSNYQKNVDPGYLVITFMIKSKRFFVGWDYRGYVLDDRNGDPILDQEPDSQVVIDRIKKLFTEVK